jgi:chromate transporter
VLAVFLAFARIGLTSFGGGLSGWLLRELVQRRRWLGEKEFFASLALAQAFPGVNVVNVSILIGYRLCRWPGALAAAIGLVVPAAFVAIGIAAVFEGLLRFPATRPALAGIAAAAIGLSLQMAVRAVRRAVSGPLPAALFAATFLALAVLRLPLLPVIAVAAPVGIGAAFLRLRRKG